jgi:hypothetical protein
MDEPKQALRRTPPHETVRVSVGDLSADVDVGLAGIIEALWRLGVPTRACCEDEFSQRTQSGSGRAYIAFDTSAEMTSFLELFEDSPLSEHRWQSWAWSDGPGSALIEQEPIGWRYQISVRRPVPGKRGVQIGGSARIPVSDLPLIQQVLLERLQDGAQSTT